MLHPDDVRMRKRILISILIIPALAYIIYAPFLSGILFFLFLLLLSFFASREIHHLIRRAMSFKHDKKSVLWFVLPPPLILTAEFTIRFVNAFPCAMLYTGAAIAVLLFVLSMIRYGPEKGAHRFLLFFANFVYCGVFPLLLLLLHGRYRGFMFIYFLFISAWVNDAAAYFVGSRFGRTRGFMRHSPNKSLEGYVGAFVVTMVVANVFKLVIGGGFPLDFAQTNVTGFAIALTAPLGDLGESLFKRKTGVKDSSSFLPGLGGVLDVFDSVLLSVPVYYTLVLFIL
jgi:phosphatidate cytidylyltransferase